MNPSLRDLPTNDWPVFLVVQTGMPPNVVTRSREIIYDCLQLNIRFIKNKFGPLPLSLTRPNMHW